MAKSITDKPSGQFIALPLALIKSADFRELGGNACKLLIAIYSQYNGRNNGDLTAAWTVMHEQHGFSSKSTLARALDELLQAQLIVRTREGFFQNPGGRCALYAVTWLPVHDCPGKRLDHPPTIRALRQFSMEQNKKPGPISGQGSPSKRGRQIALSPSKQDQA